MKFIIEGVDRLGKSTLIDGIQNELGYHVVIHLDKPKSLDAYNRFGDSGPRLYQQHVYDNMALILSAPHVDVILDRGHLGECVYAPMYRDYSGDYVFQLERNFSLDTKLILLTTDNFDFVEDDGEGFDFSKIEQEQELFKQAFKKSRIRDKFIVNIHAGNGRRKTREEVLNEVLKNCLRND